VELRTFTPDQEADLQSLLESDPGYTERVTGYPPGPSDALSLTVTRPEGVGEHQKYVLGAWRPGPGDRDDLVGVVDLIRGYPDPSYAFVGLLLVRWELQGTGVGREIWQHAEELVAGWDEISRVRLAVVQTNAGMALGFWKAMGFEETGERKPYRYDQLESTAILLEKPVCRRLVTDE
jgi:ribosomal protein S18 acetylase RimI-like enzyme